MLCVTSFEFPIDRWSPLCFQQSFLRSHTLGFSARAITVTHISLSSERKWKLWRRRDVPRLMSIIIDEPSAARRASSRGRWCEVDEHFPSDREKKWKFSCVPEKLIHYITDLQWSLSLSHSITRSFGSPLLLLLIEVDRHTQQKGESTTRKLSHNWLIDWLISLLGERRKVEFDRSFNFYSPISCERALESPKSNVVTPRIFVREELSMCVM